MRRRARGNWERTSSRSAAPVGVLNTVLDERANLVSAPTLAAERGLGVSETSRARERGIADVVEVAVGPAGGGKQAEFSALGTVLYGTTPRLLQLDGIAVESALAGTLLILRNRDVPNVVEEIWAR